ncbi:hypothetical protein QEH59_18335 [Coraliomargarita sp. SDUM461004]|uniref:Uncharacterized protein n=1 Tax=Thalassobacterium sedimentorum TaxID=3041258 RepID=A0ABU1ANL9_9BACT|nr:hypothetical protein [Coraliomargarita sp. SDUM461004]MDQ8196393.1 hypothetical protein [Coraliomargarita sp. SDUM461004]
MKTQVEFRSKKFPAYEDEEEEINPGLWGRRLAEYLTTKLKEKGIPIEDYFTEDWGYYLPIENKEFRLAICCSHQYGDDNEFLCFTEPRTPKVRKLFKKIDASEQLGKITKAMDEILTSDPDIRDVKWMEAN